MCVHRNPLHCLVPPHVLRALAEGKDRRLREAALRTIALSARIRGRREILGSVRAAVPGVLPGGKQRAIYDAAHGTQLPPAPGQKVRGEGDPPSDDEAVNEAYDGLGATYDLYSEVFGRDSIDGKGMPLVGVVHYGNDFNNAFWDGAEMVFGDGDGQIFVGFTKAIDVIGHELTHGVTEHTANLEYHKQSGALNESFSDVFGSLVKQHALGQDAHSADWLIGAGILGPTIHGKALRSMKDPGSAYDDPKLGGKDPQPKDMDGYVDLPDDPWDDNGGVHLNSGIPNHAFYLVADELGGNAWEDAGAIWYNALLQLWSTAQFADCASVTAQVAGALFGSGSKQQQAVRDAWEQVKVKVAARPAPPARKRRPKVAALESNGAELKAQLEKLSEAIRHTVEALP
jgi:Zn-dependent metalloprotease